MLSVKQGGIKYYFWGFDMTQPGIETQSSGPLANTVHIRPKQISSYLMILLIIEIYIFKILEKVRWIPKRIIMYIDSVIYK